MVFEKAVKNQLKLHLAEKGVARVAKAVHHPYTKAIAKTSEISVL